MPIVYQRENNVLLTPRQQLLELGIDPQRFLSANLVDYPEIGIHHLADSPIPYPAECRHLTPGHYTTVRFHLA